MKRKWIYLGCVLALLAGACAPRSVVLAPGPVIWPEGATVAAELAPPAWSLWVPPVRDARPGAVDAAAAVGTFYTRFQKTAQQVSLAPEPAHYVREQLSRFLLHHQWEASAAQRALLHLNVELTGFSLEEVPGSVWDEITLRVAYTISFTDRSGQVLGNLRLAGERVLQTPGGATGQAAEAFRDALGDTFAQILTSNVFRQAVQAVRQGGEGRQQ